jgi:hypothetical protein
VVVSSGEGVGKLQCAVGKLDAGSIGAEEGRGGVLHGDRSSPERRGTTATGLR